MIPRHKYYVDPDRNMSGHCREGTIVNVLGMIITRFWVTEPRMSLDKHLDGMPALGPRDGFFDAEREFQIVAALAAFRAFEMKVHESFHEKADVEMPSSVRGLRVIRIRSAHDVCAWRTKTVLQLTGPSKI